MKKIMPFLTENKGSVSLFIIMFVVTILTSAISSLCGARELTKVVVSASVSIIALMGINTLEDLLGMRLGDNKHPAVLGIIIGIWVILI